MPQKLSLSLSKKQIFFWSNRCFSPIDSFFFFFSIPQFFLSGLLRRMGCVNGKSVGLTDEDLDFISRNTAVTREEV